MALRSVWEDAKAARAAGKPTEKETEQGLLSQALEEWRRRVRERREKQERKQAMEEKKRQQEALEEEEARLHAQLEAIARDSQIAETRRDRSLSKITTWYSGVFFLLRRRLFWANRN